MSNRYSNVFILSFFENTIVEYGLTYCTFKMKCNQMDYINKMLIIFFFSLTVLIYLKHGEFVIFVFWNVLLNVLGSIYMKIGMYCRETLFQHIPVYF